MKYISEKMRFISGALFYGFIRSVIFWPLAISLFIVDVTLLYAVFLAVFNGLNHFLDFIRTVLYSLNQLFDRGYYCLLVLVLTGAIIDCHLGVFRVFKDLNRSVLRFASLLRGTGDE